MRKILLLLIVAFLFSNTSNAQNSLALDGINDYVSTNINSLTGNANRTIEAWIKISTPVTSQKVIVGMGTMPLGTRFTLNVLNSKLRIEIGGGGINSSKPIDDNTWHHVAVTYDNAATTKFKLYVDGALDGSGNITAAPVNTAAGTGVTIGRRNDAVNYFNGIIDEVRIWNTVRTATEIQANLNKELCNTTGLIGYYQLNQGTANGNNSSLTIANDNSGNNKNGTLNNFALSGSASNWTTGKTLAASANTTSSMSVTACDNYISPSGATYTNSQVINDIISNTAGCDSIITITLTINNNTMSSITASDCISYTAPSGMVYTNSGTFTDTIPNAAGCDSLITLQLSIGSTSSNIMASDCASYTAPSGTVYTNSGTFTDTIPNADGCDSLITIQLSIGGTSSSFSTTVCGSYTAPSGSIYTSSQTVVDIIQNTSGCDSTMTINLTVSNADTTVTMNGDTLTATAMNSTFQWIDCNTNMPITGETNANFQPTASGDYAVIITNSDNCTDTTSCYTITLTNTNKVDFSNEFNFYPNPITDILQIEASEKFINSRAVLTTVTGQTLKMILLNKTVNTLNVADFSNGFYFLSIYHKDKLIHAQRVIIQK